MEKFNINFWQNADGHLIEISMTIDDFEYLIEQALTGNDDFFDEVIEQVDKLYQDIYFHKKVGDA